MQLESITIRDNASKDQFNRRRFKKALNLDWCTRANCTTCGSGDYKAEIEMHLGPDTKRLIQDVKYCNFNVLEQKQDWEGGLQILFYGYSELIDKNEVLNAWLKRQDISTRQLDHLFFFLVRNSDNAPLREKWIRKLAGIAKQTKDTSLVETILLGIKTNVEQYPELCALIEADLIHDPKLNKLYRKASKRQNKQ